MSRMNSSIQLESTSNIISSSPLMCRVACRLVSRPCPGHTICNVTVTHVTGSMQSGRRVFPLALQHLYAQTPFT